MNITILLINNSWLPVPTVYKIQIYTGEGTGHYFWKEGGVGVKEKCCNRKRGGGGGVTLEFLLS